MNFANKFDGKSFFYFEKKKSCIGTNSQYYRFGLTTDSGRCTIILIGKSLSQVRFLGDGNFLSEI